MSIPGLLIRFFSYYILFTIIIGAVLIYFNIDGAKSLNFALLVFLVMWLSESFGKKNKRYFTKVEMFIVILGMIFLDTIIQLLFALAALSQRTEEMPLDILIVSLGIVAFLHGFIIIIFVAMTKKRLLKKNIISNEDVENIN